MLRKSLALLGLLLILSSAFFGMAWIQYWDATWDAAQDLSPDDEELEFWQLVQSIVRLSHEQVFISSLVALLLGAVLTIPWWRERLQRENVWWDNRNGPLDSPPRIP